MTINNYDDYVHIDEAREKHLYTALCQKEDEEREEARTIKGLTSATKWLDRYDSAMIAFEEGSPRKLINLETFLGITWKMPAKYSDSCGNHSHVV
jgi:hypothetical protein